MLRKKYKTKLFLACSLTALSINAQAISSTVTSANGTPPPSVSDAFTAVNNSADAGDIISIEIPGSDNNELTSSPTVTFNKANGNLLVTNTDIYSATLVSRGLRPTATQTGLIFNIGTLNQPIANGPDVTIQDAMGIFKIINVLSGTLRPEFIPLASQDIGGDIFEGTNTFSQFGPISELNISKDAIVFFTHDSSPNLKINGAGKLVVDNLFTITDTSYDGSTIENIDVDGYFRISAAVNFPNANVVLNPSSNLDVENASIGGNLTNNGNTVYMQNGSIGGNLTNNGNTVYMQNASIGGNITNNGHIVFVGNSTVGGNSINNGNQFYVVNSTVAGNFTNNAGLALLQGTIQGNLNNNATLLIYPDQTTLNVNGDFVQGPNGLLSITLDSVSQDRLNVGGSATVDGTIRIANVSANPINTGTVFTIVSAGNGVTVPGQIVDSPSNPLVNFYTEIRGNDLVIVTGIQVIQEDSSFTGNNGNTNTNGVFDEIAPTPPQQTPQVIVTGNYFQDLLRNAPAGSDLANAFQNFIRMSVSEARDFLKQLGPGQNNNRFFTIQNNFGSLLNQIRDHLLDLGTLNGPGFINTLLFQPNTHHQEIVLPRTRMDFHNKEIHRKSNMVLLEDALKNAPTVTQRPRIFSYNGVSSVWGQIFARHSDQKQKQLFNGYGNTTGGIVLGADTKLNPNLVIGTALSYQHSNINIDNNRGDAAVRSGALSVYAAMNALQLPLQSSLYINCAATAGASHHDATRTVSVGVPGQTPVTFNAKNKHFSFDGNLAGEAGIAIKSKVVTLKPYVASDVTFVRESKYTETNAGAFNLNVAGRNAAIVDAEVGAETWKEIKGDKYTITPSARFGWARKRLLRGKRMRAGLVNQTGRFQALGATMRQGFARPSASLKVTDSSGISMTGYYKGEFGQRHKSNEGGLKVSKPL